MTPTPHYLRLVESCRRHGFEAVFDPTPPPAEVPSALWGLSHGLRIPWWVEDLECPPCARLPELQIGYSRTIEGAPLSGWSDHHYVFASISGDPIVLSTDDGRVLTAPHGIGYWRMVEIASSVDEWARCLVEWIDVVHGHFSGDIDDSTYAIRDEVTDMVFARIAAIVGEERARSWLPD